MDRATYDSWRNPLWDCRHHAETIRSDLAISLCVAALTVRRAAHDKMAQLLHSRTLFFLRCAQDLERLVQRHYRETTNAISTEQVLDASFQN